MGLIRKSDNGNTRREFYELKVKKEILDENTNGAQKKKGGLPWNALCFAFFGKFICISAQLEFLLLILYRSYIFGSHDSLWLEKITAEKSNFKNRQTHLWCLEMQMLCLLLCRSVVRTTPWYVSSCGKAPSKRFCCLPWLWSCIPLIALMQLSQWNNWELLGGDFGKTWTVYLTRFPAVSQTPASAQLRR